VPDFDVAPGFEPRVCGVFGCESACHHFCKDSLHDAAGVLAPGVLPWGTLLPERVCGAAELSRRVQPLALIINAKIHTAKMRRGNSDENEVREKFMIALRLKIICCSSV
jgi:hypothetical protein